MEPPSSDPESLRHAPNLNHLWAQWLIEELVRSGVRTAFIAPGSRSTPLTTAAARHPHMRTIVHIDERGTAFAALGFGRATGRPAAWITTSGTAVANGWPAVVEASTDGVPMLLLTADRPPELRDTAANQTIDQVKLFGEYVRWQFDLPAPTRDIDPAMVLTTADQAVHRARRTPPGPVHLNCMFRKPLAPLDDGQDDAEYTAELMGWAAADVPYTRYPRPTQTPDAASIQRVAEAIEGISRGVLVAGRLTSAAERRAVCRCADHLGWPVLPDGTSGLRLGADWTPARIAHVDQLLASAAFRADQAPKAVLHVGGRFVSKRLRQFITAAHPEPLIVARPDPSRIDPAHQVTQHIETDVEPFCTALCEQIAARDATKVTDWLAAWQQAEHRAAAALDAFVDTEESLSEPLLARMVARHIPPDQALVLASSMPVRDMQRYGDAEAAAVPVFANRGASGIDGTVATAAGVALARSAPATLVVGDLALLHDLNSLQMLRQAPVIVVAINNDGGGIFHFLPIAEVDDVFEPYFATPQGRTFASAAAMFDLPYARPSTPDAFIDAYRSACASGTSALIEVRTDRNENRDLHAELERRIARAIIPD